MVGKNDINMNKIILSAILIVLSATCTQAFAQKAEDRGTFEIELATNHSQGTFSPGINGRLSVGYVVPSGKAGVYLDWGSGCGNISETAHTVLISGGLPCYTGERFSIVPKVGLGAAARQGLFLVEGKALLCLNKFHKNVPFCLFDSAPAPNDRISHFLHGGMKRFSQFQVKL